MYQETNKPKLAPLNESGVSELLNKVRKYIAGNAYGEILVNVVIIFIRSSAPHLQYIFFPQEITRLQEENDKLKARMRTLESQVEQKHD